MLSLISIDLELCWAIESKYKLRMVAYDKALADPEIKNPSKYVESLKLPGFFRCCVYAWKKPRVEGRWTLLCQSAPKLAKKHKEVPNFLRETLGKKAKFNVRSSTKECTTTSILPGELENAVVQGVVSCLSHYAYNFVP